MPIIQFYDVTLEKFQVAQGFVYVEPFLWTHVM